MDPVNAWLLYFNLLMTAVNGLLSLAVIRRATTQARLTRRLILLKGNRRG